MFKYNSFYILKGFKRTWHFACLLITIWWITYHYDSLIGPFWRSYCPFQLRTFHQKVLYMYLQFLLYFKREFLKTLHACFLPYKELVLFSFYLIRQLEAYFTSVWTSKYHMEPCQNFWKGVFLYLDFWYVIGAILDFQSI